MLGAIMTQTVDPPSHFIKPYQTAITESHQNIAKTPQKWRMRCYGWAEAVKRDACVGSLRSYAVSHSLDQGPAEHSRVDGFSP